MIRGTSQHIQIQLLQLVVLPVCLSGYIDRRTDTPAFYAWKSKLSAEDVDAAYLNTLRVQKIHARMFDVDNKGNGVSPTANYLLSSGNSDLQQGVVPVVSITNQTILQCPAADIEKLARNCANRIDTAYRSHFNKLPDKYRFDHDRAVKTKKDHFNFPKRIRRLGKGALVSHTIRLHRIRFKDKTGIPPVDRGTLMYYASSEPTGFEDKDTILNNGDAASYIKDVGSYPLHLDIAPPLCSQGVAGNLFGQIKLISGTRQVTIGAHPGYYKQTKEGAYNILRSHYLGGVWMNKGYEPKVEEVSPETLLEATQFLRRRPQKESREIIFYYLDKKTFKQYSTQRLTDIINTFS